MARIRHLKRLPILELGELREVLTNAMKLSSGDSLFVHSSMANLKAGFPAETLVQLLVEMVGPNGNILMPFYPIKTSYQWLIEGKSFDLRKKRTSMGALPAALAAMPGARKSLHPTKSVVAVGKDADFLLGSHHLSPLPYGPASPYCRLQEIPAGKIVGVGVSSDFLSCIHVAVDLTDDYPVQPYHPVALEGRVISGEGREFRVKTYAHDLAITAGEDVPRFLNETGCPTYAEYEYKGREFFCVDAGALVAHTIAQARAGKTFFYPRSLNHRQSQRIAVDERTP